MTLYDDEDNGGGYPFNLNWNAGKAPAKGKNQPPAKNSKPPPPKTTSGSRTSTQPAPAPAAKPLPPPQPQAPPSPPPPPAAEPKSQLKNESPKASQETSVRRLSSTLDDPDEDLGVSLWKRGKRTLDIEFKFAHDDPSAQPLVCHSLIISHWSTVLSIMVEKAKDSGRRNENGQAIIEINNENFRRSDFEILIRYLYFRDVNIDKMTPIRRRRLIALSRAYHVPGLERACKKFLQYPLCAANVYLYLDEALEKEDETLKRKCLEIIRMNRGCFSPDIEYFDISPEIMHEIVSLQQLPVTEMELFTFFYKWYDTTKDGDTSTDDGQSSFTFLNNNNNTQDTRHPSANSASGQVRVYRNANNSSNKGNKTQDDDDDDDGKVAKDGGSSAVDFDLTKTVQVVEGQVKKEGIVIGNRSSRKEGGKGCQINENNNNENDHNHDDNHNHDDYVHGGEDNEVDGKNNNNNNNNNDIDDDGNDHDHNDDDIDDNDNDNDDGGS